MRMMGESRIADLPLAERTLADIQREVDAYISQYKEGYFSPLSMLARMTEEVGELAREVNHRYGEKPKKKEEAANSVEMELGDVMFIVLCFANALGIDLTEAHRRVMEKFHTRDAGRWTKKDTDNS
jgi:NTP pyrophosphatase (non-canonical NTP hydrolase)